MNRTEFEAECLRKNVSKPALAVQLGIHEASLYRKLAGSSEFTLPEIVKIRQALELDNEKLIAIFFSQESAEMQQSKGA